MLYENGASSELSERSKRDTSLGMGFGGGLKTCLLSACQAVSFTAITVVRLLQATTEQRLGVWY